MYDYQVLTTDKFDKAFHKLDKQTQKRIKAWIDKNLSEGKDPRRHGKRLTANRSGQWRYRVGDYRILADMQDKERLLILIYIGHRRNVYS